MRRHRIKSFEDEDQSDSDDNAIGKSFSSSAGSFIHEFYSTSYMFILLLIYCCSLITSKFNI